jgi:hypothetical protein
MPVCGRRGIIRHAARRSRFCRDLPARPRPGLHATALVDRARSAEDVQTDGGRSRNHGPPAARSSNCRSVSRTVGRRARSDRAAPSEHHHGNPAAARSAGPSGTAARSERQPSGEPPAPAAGLRVHADGVGHRRKHSSTGSEGRGRFESGIRQRGAVRSCRSTQRVATAAGKTEPEHDARALAERAALSIRM